MIGKINNSNDCQASADTITDLLGVACTMVAGDFDLYIYETVEDSKTGNLFKVVKIRD